MSHSGTDIDTTSLVPFKLEWAGFPESPKALRLQGGTRTDCLKAITTKSDFPAFIHSRLRFVVFTLIGISPHFFCLFPQVKEEDTFFHAVFVHLFLFLILSLPDFIKLN